MLATPEQLKHMKKLVGRGSKKEVSTGTCSVRHCLCQKTGGNVLVSWLVVVFLVRFVVSVGIFPWEIQVLSVRKASCDSRATQL